MSSFGNSISVGKPVNADSENQPQVPCNFLSRNRWATYLESGSGSDPLTAFKTFKQQICRLIFNGPLNKKEEKERKAYDSTQNEGGMGICGVGVF